MIFVAGEEEYTSQITRRGKPVRRNLSPVIDFEGIYCGHVRRWSNERVDVDWGASLFP